MSGNPIPDGSPLTDVLGLSVEMKICTYRNDATIPDDLARAIAFYPGFYAGVDIESAGLLARDSARLLRA